MTKEQLMQWKVQGRVPASRAAIFDKEWDELIDLALRGMGRGGDRITNEEIRDIAFKYSAHSNFRSIIEMAIREALALRGLDSREAVLEKAALAIRPVIEERGDEQHAWNCALTWAMTTIRALKSKPASPKEPT